MICDSVNRDFFIGPPLASQSCQKSPVIAVYPSGKLTPGPAASGAAFLPVERSPGRRTSAARCRPYWQQDATRRQSLGLGRTGESWLHAPKAQAISKGGSPPDNCRLVWELGRGIRDLVLAMLWAAPRRRGEDRALPRGEHWPPDRAPPGRKPRVSSLTGDDRCRCEKPATKAVYRTFTARQTAARKIMINHRVGISTIRIRGLTHAFPDQAWKRITKESDINGCGGQDLNL
jgi:hypothetical protein